jgi:hypothetical protein
MKQNTQNGTYITIRIHKHNNKNIIIIIITTSSSSSVGCTTLGGFRPAQLPLSILSRKVFSVCRCQRHVKPPTWRRIRDLERSNFRHKRPPASEATLANPAAEGGTMGEKWRRNFAESATSTSLLGSFTCRKARHVTDGFTSPPKEGVLRIFFIIITTNYNSVVSRWQ